MSHYYLLAALTSRTARGAHSRLLSLSHKSQRQKKGEGRRRKLKLFSRKKVQSRAKKGKNVLGNLDPHGSGAARGEQNENGD